ncbi:hypothetical protein LAD67_09675 [Escherichia coli]|nr:hypothetical protein [Escherichia coli]
MVTAIWRIASFFPHSGDDIGKVAGVREASRLSAPFSVTRMAKARNPAIS